MVFRTSVCILVLTWLGAIHPVVGNEFKFVYNYSSNAIQLQVIYDGFRIERINLYNYNRNFAENEVNYYIWIPNIISCVIYPVSAEVRDLKTNLIFPYHENISTIPQDIVLQIVPDRTAINVEVNSIHNNYCYQSIYLNVDNSKYILYTKTNLSSWLTLPDLSPCVNYNLKIYIKNHQLIYEIFNKIVRTVSMEFRDAKATSYDPVSNLLSWPNFLGDCTLKYQITIWQEINSTVLEPLQRESVLNEYKLDFLEGCSKYLVKITSEGNLDASTNFYFYTEYKAPSRIQNLIADVINSTLLISWSPPAKNPACFGSYNIFIDQTLFTTTAHEHAVLDYEPCKDYNISICQDALSSNCVDYTFDSSKFEITEMYNVSKIHVSTNYNEHRTTIVWNVPKRNELCVKYYDVRLYELDGDLEYVNQRVISGLVEFGQLAACQKYGLHIESVPAKHWPTKIESHFEFTTKPTKPIAPQPPTLISKTSTSLIVETKYVNQNDKCKIEMFQISCYGSQAIIHRLIYDEEGRGTLTNLRSSTMYFCSAKVKNEVGWSIPSEKKQYFVDMPTSDPVVTVYVNSVSSKSIDISWSTNKRAVLWLLTIAKVESLEKYPKHCEFSSYNNSFQLNKRKNGAYKIDNLEPYTNYSIRVIDSTNPNYRDQIFATTDPDVPFQVTNLKIASLTSRSVTITWQLPCNLNGRIKSFRGRIIENDPSNSEPPIYDWSAPYQDDMNNREIFNYTETRIKPDHNYNISVAIKLTNYLGPLNETVIEFNSIGDRTPLSGWATINEENSELWINEELLADYKDNKFKLVISELDCNHDECTRECHFNTLPSTVKISLADNISPHCEIIDHNHIDLKKGVKYTLKGLLSTSSGVIINTPLIVFSDSNTRLRYPLFAIVVTILVCLSIVMGLITWYCMVMRKQQTQPLDSTYIEVEYFYDFFKLLAQDYYIDEYQAINDIDLGDHSMSMSMNQPGKNRYTDITPYDYNRVVLMPNEFCTSDYINASYIDGYKHKRQYIATQGPTEATVYDFWHMIVDQKCDKIVMLTQFEEDSVTKCFKYFPFEDEILEFNDLRIANVDETNFGKFIRRGLAISKGQAQRFIIHYQFNAWPDRGCPTNELDLIEFIEFTKSADNKTTNPMVVHCSAGVGRTGTFIALDVLFQSFRKDKFISISETVRKLRRQRCRMVQTVDQYEFLYVTVNMYYLIRMYKGALVGNREE